MALKEHAAHGEKGHSDKSKKHKHKEGDSKSFGHKHHEDHHKAYEGKEGHKEAKGESSGHGKGHGHGDKGSHSAPVKKIVSTTVLKPASTGMNSPAVAELDDKVSKSPVKQGLAINIEVQPLEQHHQQQQYLQKQQQQQQQELQKQQQNNPHFNKQHLENLQKLQLQQLLLQQQQQQLLQQQQQAEHERLLQAQSLSGDLQAQSAQEVPVPVIIYQPGSSGISTAFSTTQASVPNESSTSSIFYFTDTAMPQNNEVDTKSRIRNAPTPEPIKIMHLPLLTGLKQTDERQSVVSYASFEKSTAQPANVVVPHDRISDQNPNIVHRQVVSHPEKLTSVKEDFIVQQSSNVLAHPARSHELSEDELLLHLIVQNKIPAHIQDKIESDNSGIEVRAKGESPQALGPVLKKEKSQQVSLVVGSEEIKPASSDGHGHPHGGKDYHESSGAQKKLYKEEGTEASKGGKEKEGFKKEQHKAHDKKHHKKFIDKGGKKHHEKEHQESYKGHFKKGKKGKKGHKKGSKKTFKKGHHDKGSKTHHHTKIYSKKKDYYDENDMKKHFQSHENFDSLFDKHKKGYKKSGGFSGEKHHKSFGDSKHHGTKKSRTHHNKHKKGHGKKNIFDNFHDFDHKKIHHSSNHSPKSSHDYFSDGFHHESGGHHNHHHGFTDLGSHHHKFSGSNNVENIIKKMSG
ncbi:hypothetical protein HAZT_HAZT006391 [Hyalella azteca]|uniref:Uncharacterized protein n=1 Tax=Hyalella azteca TaxID=294128 RepID=A0A6A0H7Y6_HYAAZ|nr:hypothetical protein HAZT_HAZT006391 [Hyalella azteca]